HFGRVAGSIPEHFDVLEEHVRRWAAWFRDRASAGADEEQLFPIFKDYEAAELQARGASADDVLGYEAADPSHMAVTAALRYWRKYHPEEIAP
ncbi:MAG: MBL fold metallo-hydrolase, partial [Verrucomicrobiota bacterium]|nr:MBL fold metallo-hydrolase [Verrucomicrobiota bacterium]